VNEAICHGIPDQRPLKEGDILNIDVTLYYDGQYNIPSFLPLILHPSSSGFHGDLNETYPVGKIEDDSERLIRTTRQALDEAIKTCKPGTLFRDIGKVM
jgi:methionyl aminopeptidase